MAILIDYNQLVISTVSIAAKHIDEVTPEIVRHLFLNNLKSYRKKYRKEYGEVVICCDSEHSWRKDFYPYYKAKRAAGREKIALDWDLVFSSMHSLVDELDEYFPYKVVKVYGAEGDDVIAVLARMLHEQEKIMIISSDKDFLQLQHYKGVKQYSPIVQKLIKEPKPLVYLKEHTIKGDSGDGVPNILSDDKVFVEGVRQRPIRQKKLNEWLHADPEDFCNEEMLRNYQRNEKLVNLLDCVPEELEEKIIDRYKEAKVAPRSGLFDYFVEKRLRNLIDSIQEF